MQIVNKQCLDVFLVSIVWRCAIGLHSSLRFYSHRRGRWKWRTWKCRTCFRCL